jgi:hypothetical protein
MGNNMLDFKIKQGLSTDLFIKPGVVNPRLIIEPGCWYLCTDTASLFLGVSTASGKELKRINRAELVDPDVDVAQALEALANRLNELEAINLFKKISSESELPTDFEAADFNPNITYYKELGPGRINTFIFDIESKSYCSTSNIDELLIRTMVTEAIDEVLLSRIDVLVPEAVEKVISTTILYGGDANPFDD